MPTLARSFHDIIRRHEALRASFATTEEQLVRITSSAMHLNLTFVDLCSLSYTVQESEVVRLEAQEAQRLFDFVYGPMLRVTLFRLDSDTHILQLTMHHIIGDGWSISILWRKFSTLYSAYPKDRSSPLYGLAYSICRLRLLAVLITGE